MVLSELMSKQSVKTNGLGKVACRGRKAPRQLLRTEPRAFSVLVRAWRAAARTAKWLLTLQLLLLTGMGRAERKESFRLKEERRDADGEGDPPCGLRLRLR